MIFKTKNPRQTKFLAKKLAGRLHPPVVLALIGDLGGGKTTFIQGLISFWGKRIKITSPTFLLWQKYSFKKKKINFYHLDLYRLQNIQDLQELGIKEIFADKKGIVAIEWAEKIRKLLPQKSIKINFQFINHSTRRIKIQPWPKKKK